VTVTNKGQGTSTNIGISFEMFLDDSIRVHPIQGCSTLGRFVTCNFTASLASGASLSRDFIFIAQSPGTTQIKAKVFANETDTDSTNDSATQTTTVRSQADLSVSLTPSTESLGVDREFTYAVKVKNNGPNPATSTLLEIRLPANTHLLAAVAGCSRAPSNRDMECQMGTLASGEERSLQIRLRPTARGTNSMRASVSSTAFDPSTDNNTARKTIDVQDVPRPANNNFNAAQALQGEHININGTNVNATVETVYIPYDPNVGERFHAGKAASKSVWYIWISPAKRGQVAITTAGSNFDTLLEVREVIPNQTIMPVVAKDDDGGGNRTSAVAFTYNPETIYYIAVDGYNGASGDITFKLDVTLFEDPGDYRVQQRITGFSPAFACAENSDPNDIICGKNRDANGFLILTVKGVNFTNTSQVRIDGKPLKGFDRNGAPANGFTEFISSTELRAHIPPNPPLLIQKIDQIGVFTPVTLNTAILSKLGMQPVLSDLKDFLAVATNVGLLSVVQLRNATIPPGATQTVCGNTQFNKAGEETCLELVNFGFSPVTVSPTWFAAVAYCQVAANNNSLQCATDLANGKIIGSQFAINPLTVNAPSKITIRQRTDLPPGTTSFGTVKVLMEGGKLVGLDGGTLVGNDGGTMVAAGAGNLVGNDGNSMVAAGGLNLIGNDGGTMVAAGGGNLIGNDGGTITHGITSSPAQKSGKQEDSGTSTRPSLGGQRTGGALSPLKSSDVSKSSTGFFVARSSGGQEPTVTIHTDEVMGETYAILEFTLDETSTPKASNVAGLAFAIALDPAVVQLQSTNINVNEGAGSVTLNVVRTGDASGPASFDFATSDTAGLTSCNPTVGGQTGKASERCDFATSLGTVSFAAGETTRSITIPIVDDTHSEGAETFTLTIGNATGAAIQMPSAATITIEDNDSALPSSNPLDGVSFFIRQQYLDFLGRTPDPTGFQNWMATLQGCPGGGYGTNNPTCDRIHIAQSTFQSEEFQTRGYWAYRFYEVAYGRRPNYAEFIPEMALVGGPKSPQEEALSKDQYMQAFVLRPEFTQKYGSLTDDTAFVDALLQAAGLANLSIRGSLISGLQSGQKTRAQVLREIVETKDVEDKFYVRGFVSMMYYGFLRRDPDPTGFQNYVNQLNQTWDPRKVTFDFIYSPEYMGRFGKP
jgi:hypothetical protein